MSDPKADHQPSAEGRAWAAINACGKGSLACATHIAAAILAAQVEAWQEAARAVRDACQPCGGTGGQLVAGPPVQENEEWEQCPYCGYPMAAIEALIAVAAPPRVAEPKE